MKNRFHVFCHKFTELAEVNMLVFFLLALLMAPSAWAADEFVTQNDQTVYLCNGTKMVEVYSGIETLQVSGGGGSVKGCIGKMTLKAPDGYGFVMSGWTSAPGKITIYDGYQFNLSYAVLSTSSTSGNSNISDLRNTSEYVSVALDDAKSPDRVLYLKLKVKKLHSVKAGGQQVIYTPYPATWYLLDDIKMIEDYSVYLYTVNNGKWITTSLKVKDADSNLVSTKGYNDSLQFYMPKKDVRVTYSEELVNQLEYIDMLCMTRTVNLTDKVKSFKIYDNGGKSEGYTTNCEARLSLIPPDGYQIRLTGTVTTEAAGDNPYDYLEIDDGETIVKKVFSTTSNSTVSVGTVTTTHRSMYLYFHSDQSNVAAGLNLTAELVGDPHTVTVNSANNGTVTPSSSSVATGDEVTLTAKPKSGYALKSVSVVTTSGATVSATSNWETNEIKFTMPNSNVTVTPTFVKDKYAIAKVTVEGGTITVADSAMMNSTVTITANPETGYMLKEIVVKEKASGNIIKLLKNKFTSFSFTMPLFSDVTVTPTWTNDLTAEGGLYVDMPKTGNSILSIPQGVKSFKVYDDGGKDGSYSNNAEGKLILIAPAGYFLVLTGNVNTYNSSDKLLVYKNNQATDANLLGTLSGGSYCAYSSEARYMAIMFVSDGSGNASGLNLTVKVIKYELEQGNDGENHYVNMFFLHNMTYEIPETLKSFKVYDEGGKDGAYSGNNRDTLVLKAPAGYALQLSGSVKTYSIYSDSLKVYDGAGVSGSLLGAYTGYSDGDARTIGGKVLSKANSMTLVFKSGKSGSSGLDLTVKLVKLELEQGNDGENHYVNMFFQHNMTYEIPETLKSFKVYDEGGKDGAYSGNNRDTLVLKAPAGYALQLSGSVTTQYSSDSLHVYSGTVGNADTVLLGKYNSSSGVEAESISGKVLSRGNSMTLVFKSNGSFNYAGLDLTVTLVKLELEQGNDGENHYVNMFFQHNMTYEIPETLKSFKVYDEGGKDGNYSGNNRDTLVLKAPAGYVLQLSGSVTTQYSSDSLHVYSGTVGNADTVLLGKYNSSSGGEAESISGKVLSRGNSMTLVFKSSGSFNYAGLDLTVTLVKLELEQGNDGENHYVNMFFQHNMTYEIPETLKSFKVYDEGGKDGNYSGNNRDTLVLKAPAGYVLQLSGSVTTQYSYDSLRVYNGAGVNADSLLGKYRSSTSGEAVSISGKVLSRGNSMTLVFNSNGSFNYAGLDLTVTLVPKDYTVAVTNVAGGSLADVPETASTGDLVTLTAVPTNSNYMLVKFVVKDAAGNEVPVIRNTLTEGKFKMPASNVTITPVFADTRSTDITATDGFHLDMPRNNIVEINLPVAVKSFKLYDHGGKTGDYIRKSDDHFVFNAPAGYHFKVTGSMNLDGIWDNLYVYDGMSTILFNHHGAENGATYDVGPIETSLNKMMVFFHADDNNLNYAGFDLTVTVVPNSYTVVINQISGGTLFSDKESAAVGEMVTLTATPDEGYMLNGFVIKDASGNDVPFRGGDFIDKQGSFTMPASNVTVTPVFTQDYTDIFVTVPATGTKTFEIPEGVESFKVYDDGGPDLAYSLAADGSLVLIAPEGSKIKFAGTGEAHAYRKGMIPSAYDGTSSDATQLTWTKTIFQNGFISTSNAFMVNIKTLDVPFTQDDYDYQRFLGINATVTVISPSVQIVDVDGGSVTADDVYPSEGDVVTLTATPDEGYMLNGFVIKDASGNDVPFRGGDFIDKKGSFTMPAGNVTVTPVFTNKPIDLFVTIPATGTKTVNLLDGMNAFYVYDDGGSTGLLGHSYNANGSLVLIAPENATMNATVMWMEGENSAAWVETFDGTSSDAPSFGKADPEYRHRYTSTGNAMTFSMTTSANVTGQVNIIINVIAKRNINVVSVDGGTAASDKTTADRNETVTVTATPDDGLLFKGVKVTNKFGDVLGMKGYETWANDIWTAGGITNLTQRVSFRMPNSDINVEPMFGEEVEASDSVFLEMPETGSKTVAIPPRIASFNVYDDGGRGGTFSSNADGNLVLTAPEGYRFQVSGSVSARAKDIAHLCVYEGGTVSDDKALVCGTGSVFAAAATDQDYDSYVGEIGTTVSEGNTITLRFWTTSSWETGDGIELVVTVLKPHYGAVTIVKREDGTSKAILDGNYNGSEAIKIASPIAVNEIDFQRAFSARTPSTAILPFSLPEGSTTNAEFYQLTEVKQVNRSWKARFDYIGDGVLPQANTPYALILPAGQTKLEFNLNNKQAMVQTSNIDTVKVSNDDWLFVGVYSYKVWEPGDEELGLAYAFSGKDNSNEGKFGKIKIADNATKLSDYPYANPLRAYLRKKDAGVVLKARGRAVASPVASFGLENLPETIDAEFVRETANGEKTTFVGRMNTRTGEFKMLRDYDLKGRRVNGTNKARGAYYGKKVIKK